MSSGYPSLSNFGNTEESPYVVAALLNPDVVVSFLLFVLKSIPFYCVENSNRVSLLFCWI